MSRQERRSRRATNAPAPMSSKISTPNAAPTVARSRGARHADASAEYAPPLVGQRRCTIAVRCPHCSYIEARFAEAEALLAGTVIRRCRRTGGTYRIVVEHQAVVAA